MPIASAGGQHAHTKFEPSRSPRGIMSGTQGSITALTTVVFTIDQCGNTRHCDGVSLVSILSFATPAT